MNKAKKYAKVFICSLILVIALIAPVTTGISNKNQDTSQLRNQIDESSFIPQWNEDLLNSINNAQDASEKDTLSRSVWELNSAQNMSETAADPTNIGNALADTLAQDSGSGYNKLTEMAQNGYADFGTKVVGGHQVEAGDTQSLNAAQNPEWEDYPGRSSSDDSSRDDNAYTVVPEPENPVDDGQGGNGDNGGGTIPDNPVVPAPAALVLTALGGAIVRILVKRTEYGSEQGIKLLGIRQEGSFCSGKIFPVPRSDGKGFLNSSLAS
jgi:hypothetical protein